MIAVHTDILVYAHRNDSEWFESASRAIGDLADHPPFLRPRLSTSNTSNTRIKSPSLRLIGELQDHWTELVGMLSAGQILGGGVHDARIATICVEHGVKEFWTRDRDFGRFAGFPIVNPLLR